MRYAPLFALCVVALSACALVADGGEPANSQGQPAPAIVDDRELLVLTTEPPGPLTAQVQQLGYVVTRIDQLDALQEILIYLRIPAGLTIPDAIVEVEALQPGVTAGANHAYRVQALPGGQDFANEIIGWPAAGCPAHRDIGLIDAGVMPNHPALEAGKIVQSVFHGSEAPPSTDHGTLMADLLIGEGRLTEAKLYSANVVDPVRATGDIAGVDGILRAVDWLKSQGVDLVNVSLAGPFNKLLNRALGGAAADGMVLIAAAGNLGPDAPPQYPAAFPFVLAVTAVDRNLAVYRLAVQGDHIDLAAPGVDIIVKSAGKLRVLSGTSAAAPYVTAMVAADEDLVWPTSVDIVRRQLERQATDLGPQGRDRTFGSGLIRAMNACNGLG